MLECKVCGKQFKNNIVSHIKHKHNLTGTEYKNLYNSPVLIQSEETKKKISISVANNNHYSVQYWVNKGMTPDDARAHITQLGKKNSVRGVEYWVGRGHSVAEAKKIVSTIQSAGGKKQKASKHKWLAEGYSEKDAEQMAKSFLKERLFLHKEYWISRHNLTESAAEEKIVSIQKEYSSRSKKFTGKTHSNESKKKISDTMKSVINDKGSQEWSSHFGNFHNGRSLLEDEVYQFVKNSFPKTEQGVKIGKYVVDIALDKKVIEVFGDYWHANPTKYMHEDIIIYPNKRSELVSDIWENDRLRIEVLRDAGYKVLVVWESEWRRYQEKAKETIMEFLYDCK